MRNAAFWTLLVTRSLVIWRRRAWIALPRMRRARIALTRRRGTWIALPWRWSTSRRIASFVTHGKLFPQGYKFTSDSFKGVQLSRSLVTTIAHKL